MRAKAGQGMAGMAWHAFVRVCLCLITCSHFRGHLPQKLTERTCQMFLVKKKKQTRGP